MAYFRGVFRKMSFGLAVYNFNDILFKVYCFLLQEDDNNVDDGQDCIGVDDDDADAEL